MSYKLLICLPSLHLVGGMEKVLTIKASYFAEVYGYDVTIVLTDGKDESPYFPLSDKVKILHLDIDFEKIRLYPIYIKIPIYLYKQYIYKRRLTKVLMSTRPDITISMLRREVNFFADINDGSKKIGELQFNKLNYRDFNTKGEASGIKGFFAKYWMKQLVTNLKKVDKFVVLSEEDKKNWTELDNVVVIHNPIESIPEESSNCTSKKVIAAGRLVSQKGFDMLIDSWKIVNDRHPDWTLSIYGNGSKEYFINQIELNGIKSSCFLYDAVLNINEKFIESSIFAFSSRFEGFGMVITEAMSCGIPPVAFACPCGPKDIITDGVDGILVTPESVDELADKICFLIENEDIRREMGRRARIRAEQFKIEVIAKEWNTLFKNLLTPDN
ncbi:MAG: glycosyltransferase family 4 protein [Bacteroidetes bacterium HGW-Bacteroidetes-8]|jgi:glycosyltransferase involved in cell wall biosynthesis|nr:MAG: glycosyltransferase family 4 protein [Bacteroidetes bacterium HGW-Bacteroidetes-8]